MQSVDGDVRLYIGANTDKAKKAINDLERNVKGVFSAFKGQRVSNPQLDQLEAKAEQSKQKIVELQNTIKEMQNSFSSKPTEEMQRLIDKENELEAEAKRVKEQITSTTPKPLAEKYTSQYNAIRKEIEQISNQQLNLERSGKAFVTVVRQQPEAFAKANEQLRQEQTNLSGIQSKIEQIKYSGSQSTKGVNDSFKKLGASIGNIFSKIRQNSKRSAKEASDSFNSINGAVKKGIKTLLKYGLGVRSFFFLFRRLRAAVIDSYKELATFSTEINDSVSSVKSSLSKLKNSVAAAVQPLITAFAPLVTSLANRLTEVMTTIGQFFAALTGQDYVYKALDVQENYADALDDTADSANKARKALDKYLSPLDDINRYNAEDSTEGDSGANTAAKFNKSNISGNFQSLANTIKGYFKDIFKPIKDAWDRYGFTVIFSWHRMLSNIKGLIRDIARDFRNVWTNGSGERFAGNIFKIFRSVLDIVNAIVDTFRKAWNKDGLGQQVIQSFIDRFNNMLEFIRLVADTFREVWEDGTGERIWSDILNIVKNIQNIIGGFWKNLRDAWAENETGKKIWEAILGTIEDIVGWFKEMSDITLDWVSDLDFSPVLESIKLLLEAFRDFLKVIGGKLKDGYKKVLLPLAKWTFEKALPALINLIAGALEYLGNVLDKIPVDVLADLAVVIGSVFLAFKAAKIILNVITWISKLGAAFNSFFTVLSMHPYAAIILAVVGALTALVVAIKSVERAEWNRSDLKKAVDEINEYSDSLNEAAENMERAVESVNEQHITVQADVSQVENLKERLKQIIQDGIISEQEMPEYKTIFGLLKEVDGFEEKWSALDLKEVDGKIVINTNIDEVNQQIDEFFDDWKTKQYQLTLQGSRTSLYETMTANERDIRKAKNSVDDLYSQLYSTIDEQFQKYKNSIFQRKVTSAGGVSGYIRALIEGRESTIALSSETVEILNSYKKATEALDRYQQAQTEIQSDYEGTYEALKYLNGENNNYIGLLYAVESGLMSESDALEIMKEAGIDSFDHLRELANRQRDNQINNNKEIQQSNSSTSKQTQDKANQTSGGVIGAYAEMMKSGKKAAYATRDAWLAALYQTEGAAWRTAKEIKSALTIGEVATSIGSGIAAVIKTNAPHLASGAVIPAGKPFMAVLGDQTSGRNLEAPESLIRQIVREETANVRGNATYTVPVQVGRDTLFTLVLSEAEMRRNQTGNNPFSMGGSY